MGLAELSKSIFSMLFWQNFKLQYQVFNIFFHANISRCDFKFYYNTLIKCIVITKSFSDLYCFFILIRLLMSGQRPELADCFLSSIKLFF